MRRNQAARGAALALALALPLASSGALAAQAAPDAEQQAFRDLYRELVETDTSVATGSCTDLAQKVAARFRAAGFAEDQVTLFSDPGLQLDGGVIVTMAGHSAKAKPMLLLGHLDVVNANPQHWQSNPYKLAERDGYYYGRGAADMKALGAIWIDTMLRLRATGHKTKRTIKLALTCGHETSARSNAVEWLTRHRPELLDAAFALTEGGGGETDGHGKVISQSLAIGEMTMANFEIETFSEGGPSAIPLYDNAISRMIDALQKVRAFRFPMRMNATTRSYFAQAGAARGGAMGAAMMRLAADPSDSAADALVSSNRKYNPLLRTTCLTTLIHGGYVVTAVPQTARATVNCYIVPGETAEDTRNALFTAIGDTQIVMNRIGTVVPEAKLPPRDDTVLRPAEKLVARYYPGVPLVPAISTLATDGAYLSTLGIPTYGVPGLSTDPDGNAIHGHDERIAVQSLMTARDFLYDLVKVYAAQE